MNMELLAPAGDMERLESAIAFGADAVYLAAKEFGMRAGPSNFTLEELEKSVRMAHEKGVRVHMTCNTLPRNEELPRLPQLLQNAQEIGIDAFIVADLGVMKVAQRHAPKVELHVSTQAGVVNFETARAFHEMGASRVVLARELSMEEIAGIRAKTPSELELEVFVHGSMCVSFSGRCLLSNYLTGRDANRGDCAQPCRWSYRLVEEKRPGEYFPIEEDEKGTYIMNSRDMCMIQHIPELAQAGVSSLKIEGRAKSAYYVAVTANAYRHAIDFYEKNPQAPLPDWIPEELNKISHREYSTGFYFGQPGQVYQNGGYVRDYEVVAVCEGWENGIARLSQRNRFFRGDVVDVLEPGGIPYLLKLDELYDEEMMPIDVAPHATMKVRTKTERSVAPGALLRKSRA
ncbi:peptidase U32 family protein [Clostridium minihomine]|uniref:peptidase U32 family protein n=1 Tax=Clostridium minihomine TaxID=2045012 RepID=UPI000C778801|nr:U32 family peptidase [Clostridium minihomine]